jgi:hypothetical protein
VSDKPLTPEERAGAVEICWAGPHLSDGLDEEGTRLAIADAIREAVAAERKACAEAIEEQGRLLKVIFEDSRHDALIRDLSAMIRKRN